MRGKTKKFEENKLFDHVIEPGKELYERLSGFWAKNYFANQQEIILELACGRGEYTIGLARLFPNKNFIGVDVKGDRIWAGAKIAREESLENVAFLRAQIEHLERFFDPQEVASLWITFPDPRPKKKEAKKRLVHPRFLDIYKKIVHRTGKIHFKTDNADLFNYALEVIDNRADIKIEKVTHDLYQSDLAAACYNIQTKFEKKYLADNVPICYMQFSFTSS